MRKSLLGAGAVVAVLAIGCGPSVEEVRSTAGTTSSGGTGGGGAGGTSSVSVGGAGGDAVGGAGGEGGALVEARLSQGLPYCVVRHGAVDCYVPPEGGAGIPPGLWHVPGIDDAVEVVCALEQTCVLRASGNVWCWGFNDHGQLGPAVPLLTYTPVPTELPQVNVVKLATAMHALCGIEPSGQVICWGGGPFAPIGDPSVYGTQTPIDVSGVPDAIDLAMSADVACAVRAGGTVVCWGTHTAPATVDGISDAVQVAVHQPTYDPLSPTACAVRADGTVVCWSDGAVVPVAGLSGVVQLSGGVLETYVYARTIDGMVLRLAWADADMLAVTVTPFDISDAIDLAGGGTRAACALHADGYVACWDESGAPTSFPPDLF
ncbi:regulator of chromosome condensation, RCC1 [Minicystis rosea]|nr:regulator of chromosome condensation, RCC1 [Minicystis rosea]